MKMKRVQQGHRAWSPDEINDALLYVIESSRTATERLVSTTVCQDYYQDGGISRSLEALEVGLSLNSIQVSSSIKITKYKRRSYIYRNPDRPSISNCSEWPGKHENAMIDYLEEEQGAELNLKTFWKNFENEYFQKFSWRESFHPSAENIGNHFSKFVKSKICTLGDRYDLNTLARMCLASSAPIDEEFLKKLQLHADHNDIILEYIRSIDSAPIKSDNADLYNFSDYQNLDILGGANTWTEVEDNDLLGYISFRAGNGNKLNMDMMFMEYKDFSKSARSVEELKKRFTNFLSSRIEGSLYLPLARAKMLYATETPISAEFRANLLNKFDINILMDNGGF
ncbi:hypothetical protein CAEBREN_15855 [Caenorhabditis brenneri]|uniref:SPK domain-containing protein n=1 Tax=Caenorhabditis brenneri TaxID=135651 RepID=G0N303_CAEBE|nr:hypothetical protein CAEBREN_15855 [Caenorhabditis brenneri]